MANGVVDEVEEGLGQAVAIGDDRQRAVVRDDDR